MTPADRLTIAMMTPHTGAVDGVQWAAQHLTSGFARRDHTVDLLFHADGSNHQAWEAVTRSRIKLASAGIFPRTPVASLKTLSSVVSAGRRRRWDVVYAQRIDMVNAAAAAALASRAPLVMYLHNDPPPWFAVNKRTVPGARVVDWVLNPSRFIRDRWAAAGVDAARMSIIPYGVDIARFAPMDEDARDRARATHGIDHDDIVVSYVGRLEHVKGVHLLVQAFARYAQDEPRARLVLVGGTGDSMGARGNEYIAGLRQQTDDDRTVWWGVTTDVAPVLGLSDVLVIPSLWQEPSAVSAVEGLATGMPVLVSRSGGMPEHFEGGLEDLVFAQDSVAAITAKLRRYGDWRRRQPGLGDRIRDHAVQRRSLDGAVTETEQLLRRLIAAPRQRRWR